MSVIRDIKIEAIQDGQRLEWLFEMGEKLMDLLFIHDETLKSMLNRDIEELELCFSNKLYKSTLILAGSIIEAILTDYFLHEGNDDKCSDPILKKDLSKLIDMAFDKGIISERLKNLASVIREYRNLIHPGLEFRERETIDFDCANIAFNVVNIFGKELSKNHCKVFINADQAMAKVSYDSYSESIFPSIVSTISLEEKQKLLRGIPQHRFELFLEKAPSNSNLINRLYKFHSSICATVNKEYLRRELDYVYHVVKSENTQKVLCLLSFYIEHLHLCRKDEFDAILLYLFDLVASGSKQVLSLFECFQLYIIGTQLDHTHEDQFYNAILRRLNFVDEYDDIFVQAIKDILGFTDNTFQDHILNMLKENSDPRVKDWVFSLEIPF